MNPKLSNNSLHQNRNQQHNYLLRATDTQLFALGAVHRMTFTAEKGNTSIKCNQSNLLMRNQLDHSHIVSILYMNILRRKCR